MLSFNTNNKFSRLMIVYLFWSISWILGGSLFEVYFFGMGLTIQEIISTSIFWFCTSLVLIPLIKKIETKKFMVAGVLITILSLILLLLLKDKQSAYIYRFLLSLTQIFFWVPFNILFYEFRKNNNATLGALYYSVGPMLMLVLPSIGGYIAQAFGYSSLYFLATVFGAITFLLAFLFLENKIYTYDAWESIKSIKGLRTLLFLEGFGAAVIVSVILEALLLKYINKPLEFGIFVSIGTAVSIIASFAIAKFSDMQKRRREFLLGASIALGLSAIFTGLTTDVTLFFIGFTLISVFKNVFFPLPLALTVDNSKDLIHSMLGREFMLNLGRISGTILVYLLLFVYNLSFALVVIGISMFAIYPITFEMKRKDLQII